MSDEAKRVANEKIAQCLELAKKSIAEAMKIADENKIEFSWSLPDGGGSSYYKPKGWQESDSCSDYEGITEGEWRSSSYYC